MKGGAHPSPFAALSFPNSKRYPFTAGLTERVFQSPNGEAEPRIYTSQKAASNQDLHYLLICKGVSMRNSVKMKTSKY